MKQEDRKKAAKRGAKSSVKRYSVRTAILTQIKKQETTANQIMKKVHPSHRSAACTYLYSNKNSMIVLVEEILHLLDLVIVDRKELRNLRKIVSSR